MANPQKGEVSFEAAGKTYVFKLDFNALCSLERIVGMPFLKFFKRKDDAWGALDMLAIFRCGLDEYQMSEKEVGKLIQSIGQAKAGAIFLEAVNAGLGEEAKATENPQQPIPFRVGNG
jgi:hypothetical protein